jgi:DNA-binding GntR family transcriptional regulator
VYRHFATLINNGTMKPGEKLPTVLEIAKLWHISYATATRSVALLRDDLYVRTTSRGTFVHLSEPDRLYQLLCDVLNQLEGAKQDPTAWHNNGESAIVGVGGSVQWNPEAERWIRQPV